MARKIATLKPLQAINGLIGVVPVFVSLREPNGGTNPRFAPLITFLG